MIIDMKFDVPKEENRERALLDYDLIIYYATQRVSNSEKVALLQKCDEYKTLYERAKEYNRDLMARIYELESINESLEEEVTGLSSELQMYEDELYI